MSNSQQLEIDKLNQTLIGQRAEIERLRHMLDHVRADNAGEIDNLMEEIDSLRSALGYQNDYITSISDPFRRRGYWYYVPPSSNNSGRDSLSTKDSGISLHYPMTSSPARRKGGHHKRSKKQESGRWVYSPFHHGHHKCHRDDDIDGASQSDSDVPLCHVAPPPGSVIYTVFPDGSPTPQGTVLYGVPPPSSGRPVAPGSVIYGPPPLGTQFVTGPPPAHFTLPWIPAGVLHCNVSSHHNLENEVGRLENIVDHLKSRCEKERRKEERLTDDIEALESRKQKLKRDVEGLHNVARKHKRRNFMEGQLDTLITERSLQHHDHLEDEIECIEKTLLKRRTELREADRLLVEAEEELQSTRGKTAELLEKYSLAKKHLSQSESDAEELERRAEETAVNLVKAEQQLRMLQANTRDLEQHRAAQENILQEINSIVSSKDAEFQSLNERIQTLNDSLQKLQDDIQIAEGKEDYHLKTLKDAESLLLEKKMLLDRLSSQISGQQEEVKELDRLLGQKEEELRLVQEHTEQRKADLKEVLREGEMEVAEKRQGIKEVDSVLENLAAQKEEVSAQLAEKRLQLVALKQEVIQEEENLQKLSSQIHKQKSELKHVLEMQQLENNELQGVKLQHEQKINDLERTQALLLQGKLELENLQRTSQRLHGETDWQKQLLEKDHQEIELLMTQMHTLQEKVEILSGEKERLEESREELERKLTQAKRALADTEESICMSSDTLEKLQSDIKDVRTELSLLNKQRQSQRQENTTTQQGLQETREELNLLKGELTDLQDQLRVVEQDLRSATRQRDDLLREQSTLKDNIAESAGRSRLLQEKEKRRVECLEQLQGAIEDKERHISQQEMRLKQMAEELAHREGQLGASASRLEEQKQKYEWELANRQNTLEGINAKAVLLEERARKLQQEGKWCEDLEEALASARHLLAEGEEQLREKTNQILVLQREAESYKEELSSLREQLTSERKREEKRIMALKDAAANQRLQQERSAEEHKLENSSLKKQLLTVEQAAYDNHERAKRLLRELTQLQTEHAALRKQLRCQEALDQRQQEVNEAVKDLKAQVKREIQTTLQDLQCAAAADHLEEDVALLLEHKQSRQSQLESLKENFPFTANSAFLPSMLDTQGHLMEEPLRGETLREQLRQQEDRLKAQLQQRMSMQADVLSRGRQQTEGCLHSLRRQVDALDELVSNTSMEPSFHSQNSSGVARSLIDEHCSPEFHSSAAHLPRNHPTGSQRTFCSR